MAVSSAVQNICTLYCGLQNIMKVPLNNKGICNNSSSHQNNTSPSSYAANHRTMNGKINGSSLLLICKLFAKSISKARNAFFAHVSITLAGGWML